MSNNSTYPSYCIVKFSALLHKVAIHFFMYSHGDSVKCTAIMLITYSASVILYSKRGMHNVQNRILFIPFVCILLH